MTKQNTDKPKSTALAPYHPTPLALRGTPGSLEEYIRAANAAPLLTEEREKELAVKLRDHALSYFDCPPILGVWAAVP